MKKSQTKILIAEDEFIIALDIKNILSRAGYPITSACSSGEESILKAESEKPDLLIIDADLKGKISGLDLCEIILNGLNIPIILLAGMDEVEVKKIIKKYNCPLLTKPFEEPALLKAVKNSLLN